MRLFTAFLFLSFYGFSQFSDPANSRYWDAGASLYARGFLGTKDQHFAVCGESFLNFGANPYAGGFVVYSDSSGTSRWEKALTAFNTEFAFESIAQWPDSSILVGGSMLNPMTNLHGGALLMLDKQGNERWKGSIENGGDSPTYVRKIEPLTDTSALVLGSRSGQGAPCFLMMIDSSGTKLWNRDFSDSNGEIMDLNGFAQLANGDLVICGSISEGAALGNPEWKGLLIKTDSAGSIKWSKKFNQPNSGFTDVITDHNTLYVRTLGMSSNGILAADTAGTTVWQADALEGDATWGPVKRRLLSFDEDSSLVFYYENFFNSTFVRLSRNGATIGALSAMGRSAGYSSHADSSMSLLLSGPVYGVKSSLVTTEHFVITHLEDNLPAKSTCIGPMNMDCPMVNGFDFEPYAISTADSYDISPALMEAVTWFPTIDQNCVEFLGGLSEEEFNVFEVYPNPASGNIVIEFSAESDFKGEGRVLDAFGKTVLTFTLSPKIHLDLQTVESGLYFIDIGQARRPVILH
jgi:hypothetical protein